MAGPYLSTVADTIQSAIAPVFLLAGIGAILNVMVGRLARIVDRARTLEEIHPRSTGPETLGSSPGSKDASQSMKHTISAVAAVNPA